MHAILRTITRNILRNTTLKFYGLITVPKFLDDSEVWTLTKNYCTISRLQKFSSTCALKEKVKRNDNVRKELSIHSIKEKMVAYNIKWKDNFN